MRRVFLIAIVTIAAVAAAPAQLLPQLPAVSALPRVDQLADDALAVPTRAGRTLDDVRRATIDRLIRDHPAQIERDPDGFPARAGEVVVDGPGGMLIATATARGYTVIERTDVLGVDFVRFAVPKGRPLKTAIDELRKLGAADVTADQIHLPSGSVRESSGQSRAAPLGGSQPMVGVIDGGAEGAAMSQGFAAGAPRANDHGSAVASLIAGSGIVRGALPGARIASADVYGSDPAGGNATAIAKAIGWMVAQRVPVVTISLVGPPNPLLGKVVAAAQARGLIVVAAVGNDGPAAPPSYPASYPAVIAVTGVDGRDRALIEAGRALHLDYAAPGADMLAAGVGGRAYKVRGTSFAAPLVAATIAHFYPALSASDIGSALRQVDGGARTIGPRAKYGRGLVCGDCRTRPK